MNNGVAALFERAKIAIWIGLVAGSSILFSLALACATPVAALTAIAGLKMSRRAALVLVMAAWAANQAVGYLVLGYPTTWDSFAWGAVIGVAAVLATLMVSEIAGRQGWLIIGVIAGFLAAFLVYEATLFAATALLPSGAEAFSLPVVSRILWINALALAGLLALHRLAMVVGLLASSPAITLSAIVPDSRRSW
jgi:hypothetical protein